MWRRSVDGQGKKIITYPRAEVRYLPQSLIPDVPRIVAGLRVGQSYSAIGCRAAGHTPGASGTFYDKAWKGRAIMPSFERQHDSTAARSLARRHLTRRNCSTYRAGYLAALMPDFRYGSHRDTRRACFEFRAAGRQPIDPAGAPHSRNGSPPDEKGDEAQLLPPLRNGETAQLRIRKSRTRRPGRRRVTTKGL